MRKLGQVCRGRGGWGRDTSLHAPPLQVWPGCAPSSSLPPFPGALQFRLGCLSCPLPPFGTARLVVIKAFRPPLRAQPRGARVGPPWPGAGVPGTEPRLLASPSRAPGAACGVRRSRRTRLQPRVCHFLTFPLVDGPLAWRLQAAVPPALAGGGSAPCTPHRAAPRGRLSMEGSPKQGRAVRWQKWLRR